VGLLPELEPAVEVLPGEEPEEDMVPEVIVVGTERGCEWALARVSGRL
jgi:hypothetical protein